MLEQRWFSGVHTDIGGGGPDPRQSNHTLTWMIDKARDAGLSFDDAYLRDNVHDAVDGSLQNSMVHIFKLRPFYRRPIGEGVPVAEATYLGGASNENVDAAVIERNLSDPKYLPPNLVAYYRAHPDALQEEATRARRCRPEETCLQLDSCITHHPEALEGSKHYGVRLVAALKEAFRVVAFLGGASGAQATLSRDAAL